MSIRLKKIINEQIEKGGAVHLKIGDIKESVTKNNMDRKILIIEGITASGKTQLGIDRYNYLVNSRNGRSDDILVFVSNRSQSYIWRTGINTEVSEGIKIASFFGFIQQEIRKYWPYILGKEGLIGKKDIEPVFMNFEASQSIVSDIVEKMIKDDKFEGVNSTPERIAVKLTSALTRAAMGGVEYEEIGKRLSYSVNEDEKIKQEVFGDVDAALKEYVNILLKNGVLDYGTGIYIYIKYLLNDNRYLNEFKRKYKNIIVDNLEDSSPVQIDLYNILAEQCDSMLMLFNPEGGHEKYGANREYIDEKIMRKFSTVVIEGNLLNNKNIITFADVLSKNVMLETSVGFSEIKCNVDVKAQFRSDMIDNIAEKLNQLLESGEKPEDIAVICPDNDIVLEYVIKKSVGKIKEIEVLSLGRKSKLIENIYAWSLLTIAMLCYDFENMKADRDDIRTMISVVIGCDEARADMIADKMYRRTRSISELKKASDTDMKFLEVIGFDNLEKYEYIREWVKREKEKTTTIDDLMRKIYVEILMKIDGAKENIAACRNLIDSAENFRKAVSKIEEGEYGKDFNYEFIRFIKSGTKAAESFFDIQDKFEKEYLMITTPILYSQVGKNHKIQIWTDVNSDGWTPRNVNELENPYVISKSWNDGNMYDFEIELKNKKKLMSTIIKTVMKKCTGDLYFYGSYYSMRGYEQESILYDGLLRTLKK